MITVLLMRMITKQSRSSLVSMPLSSLQFRLIQD